MMPEQQIILRLLVSAVLGSVVGLEREGLNWVAGLRTHMLVCVGSTLFMIVSAFGFADIIGNERVMLDPSRVAAQVVSGIGFLGAGTIILRREVVRGLTTAASLWSVAAVGLAVGGGLGHRTDLGHLSGGETAGATLLPCATGVPPHSGH